MSKGELQYYDANDPRIVSAKQERLRNRIVLALWMVLSIGWFVADFVSIKTRIPEIEVFYLMLIAVIYAASGIYMLCFVRYVRDVTREGIVCRKCDYPVSDVKNAGICPECGADLTARSAFSLTQRPAAHKRLLSACFVWLLSAMFFYIVFTN